MATRTRRYEKRSKNGCITCKQNRVKCDEIHPLCTRCSNRNLQCTYQKRILWQDEALEKGITFGRSKSNRRLTKQRNDTSLLGSTNLELTLSEMCLINQVHVQILNDCHFINCVREDFQGRKTKQNKSLKSVTLYKNVVNMYDVAEELEESQEISETENSLELISPIDFEISEILKLPELSCNFDLVQGRDYGKESHIFDFMINKIFPNCICYDGDNNSENPYLNYLVPLSTNSNILFKSLVSYGAKVYSILTKNDDYEKMSFEYKQDVLKELPELIKFKKEFNLTNWEEVFGTILILCSSNISSDCDFQWVAHSEGGKKLISTVLDSSDLSDLDPFKKFFIRYLTSHEIMRDTVSHSFIDDSNIAFETFKSERDNNIDMILGCSPNLLRLINEITKLGEYYESIESESFENKALLEQLILTEKNSILRQLDELDQKVHIERPGTEGIKTIAEIKRLATKVYLFARIDLIEFRYENNGKVPSSSASALSALIDQIIVNIKKIDYVSMTLTWPLFIIGVVGIELTEDQRWFILNRFKDMENLRNLASLRLARTTIESVWKFRDFENPNLVTWKDIISFNNETISLA